MKALLWCQCCVLESERLMDDFEEKKVYLAEEIGPTDPSRLRVCVDVSSTTASLFVFVFVLEKKRMKDE